METVEKTNIELAKNKTVDECIRYQRTHTCTSFLPLEGSPQGVCRNSIQCEPMRKALQEEPFVRQLGIIVCPNPSENLGFLIYGRKKEE